MRFAPRSPGPRKPRRLLSTSVPPVLATVLLAGSASLALPAGAGTEEAARSMRGYYEMPFPCGQEWSGKTWSSHSPSSNAIDWNRPDDDGDEVVASGPGTVTVSNKTGKTGYGRHVQVTHLGGESTMYAHLSEVVVDDGQVVDQGQLLGRVGSTGNSTGSHLHFEQRRGSKVKSAVFGGLKFAYGSTQVSRNCVDVPMAGNMVGSGVAELVLFRRDKRATFQVQQPGASPIVIPFGRTTDAPLLGDWDGDGVANVGVRRPAESMFYLATPTGTSTIMYGNPSDRPIAGDWNGDGSAEIGVHRAASAEFFMRLADGAQVQVTLGDANDIPVTGDWNGDRVTDLGVYDSATATYTLRYVAANQVPWVGTVVFGSPGDLPVVGDWDGNGVSDLGAWQPGDATFVTRRAPSAELAARSVAAVQFGRPRR